MRHFAARAFAILQGKETDLVSSNWQLMSVEITDEDGRTAHATFRIAEGRVAFQVNAGPALADPQGDREVNGPVMDAGVPRGLAFESYWADATPASSPESYEMCAREAFLAGLAHRDSGQPA